MRKPTNTINFNPRMEKITIRVSDDEKFLVQRFAEKSNLSVSDYLRNIIFTQILRLNKKNDHIINTINDIFDNIFKSYYLVYKLAQNAFGYEQAKKFIDVAKNRLQVLNNNQ